MIRLRRLSGLQDTYAMIISLAFNIVAGFISIISNINFLNFEGRNPITYKKLPFSGHSPRYQALVLFHRRISIGSLPDQTCKIPRSIRFAPSSSCLLNQTKPPTLLTPNKTSQKTQDQSPAAIEYYPQKLRVCLMNSNKLRRIFA